MEKFISYLSNSKTFLNTPFEGHVHITLGNESCDLDSTISSLFLGYFISLERPEYVVVPVLNVTQENFLLHTENCFILKQAGVDLKNLIFRDMIDFVDLFKKYTVTVSLVDHHVLNKNDEILLNYVTQIFDHRPIDNTQLWDLKKVQIRIEQVGSCTTLITDEILKANPNILTSDLAYLLYQTIVYDTIALVPERGKAKPLDIEIGLKLEKICNFKEERQMVFDRLWAAHNDITNLTPKQLLYKDLKLIDGVYIPGLPMLVEDYLKLICAHQAVTEFADNHKVTCLVLIGLDAIGTVRRDMGLYFKTKHDRLKNILWSLLMLNSDEFQFEQRTTPFDDIDLLHVYNIKLSRKQLVPLVKQAWSQFISKQ